MASSPLITGVAAIPMPTSTATQPPELSIVIPTFCERENLAPLMARIDKALAGAAWEAIIVDDDSPDGTAAEARALGGRDARIRCLRRIGRRGLAGACIEGMLASQAPFTAVMDADLQHDETLLPRMLDALRHDKADLVVATRYALGGDAGSLAGWRGKLSRVATELARRLLNSRVIDPMSGFFAIRREAFDTLAPNLSTQGFKILLDILATSKGRLRIKELPFVFRARLHGESKLDARVGLDFLGLLLKKGTRDLVPLRFLSFALVGLSGVAVHLAILFLAIRAFAVPFTAAQTTAALMAMTSNFALNNEITYAEGRLRGIAAMKGLALFYIVCSLGMLSNVGVATWIFAANGRWWIAGLVGSVVGLVWNYAMSTAAVWRVH
jgi:dolichol-phosphate mannosyltransferase